MLLEELVAAIAAPVLVESFDLGPLGSQQVHLKWDGVRTAKFLDAAMGLSTNPDPCNSPAYETMRLHGLTVAVGCLEGGELHKVTPDMLRAAGDKLATLVHRLTLMDCSNKINEHTTIYELRSKAVEKN